MTINSVAIFDALESHAQASGLFDRVGGHEPRNGPGNGLTVAFWFAGLAPVQTSGLASTSVRLIFTARIYLPALMEPQDAIDPTVIAATDALMAAYSGDFTLGGLIREVDLLGQHGQQLSALPGWLPGESPFRTVDITIPMVINDLFTQAE
jgi:hypothetical protein